VGRIAVTDGMADAAVSILESAGHEVVLGHYEVEELRTGALADFDAVVVRSATKMTSEAIEASCDGGRLGFIGRAGVGVDNIDIMSATTNGVVVCNTPGASTKSVVELTIGHLIASTRFVARADRTLRSGDWAKKNLRGSELGGKRLGLVGFGRIARGVAELAHGFGMEVNAFDPYVSAEQTDELDCLMHDDVDSLFRACTHISIHCNLSEDTHHLVNRERLAMMPDIGADGTACGSHIVNCARGGIVDESAVLDALDSGVLSSAALDVFEIEPAIGNLLLQHERFHGSPHIGAATLEAQNRVGTEMAGLLVAFFNGERPKSTIN
jgi:D-3-phosphoglycerate dehydrogenase|tara:strand:- start:26657 stop:27631 length:975 start_codon:yes stop_codon:yes gene_type:complete